MAPQDRKDRREIKGIRETRATWVPPDPKDRKVPRD